MKSLIIYITFTMTLIIKTITGQKVIEIIPQNEPEVPQFDKPLYIYTRVRHHLITNSWKKIEELELVDVIYELLDGTVLEKPRPENKTLMILPKFYNYPLTIKITAVYIDETGEEQKKTLSPNKKQRLVLKLNFTNQDVYNDAKKGSQLAVYAYDPDVLNYIDSTFNIQYKWTCKFPDSTPCSFDTSTKSNILKIPPLENSETQAHVITIEAMKFTAGLVLVKKSNIISKRIFLKKIQLNFFINGVSMAFENFYFNEKESFKIRARVYGALGVTQNWNNVTLPYEKKSHLRKWVYEGEKTRINSETKFNINLQVNSFTSGIEAELKHTPIPGTLNIDSDILIPFYKRTKLESKNYRSNDTYFNSNGPQPLQFSFGFCTNFFNGVCDGQEFFNGFSDFTSSSLRIPCICEGNTSIVLKVRGRFQNKAKIYRKIEVERIQEYGEFIDVNKAFEIVKQDRDTYPKESSFSLISFVHTFYNLLEVGILENVIEYFKKELFNIQDYDQIMNYLRSIHMFVEGLKKLRLSIQSVSADIAEIIDGFLLYKEKSSSFSLRLNGFIKNKHLEFFTTRNVDDQKWVLKQEILMTVYSLALNLFDNFQIKTDPELKNLEKLALSKLDHYLRIDTNDTKIEFRSRESTLIIGKANGENQFRFHLLTKNPSQSRYELKDDYLVKYGEYYEKSHHEEQILGVILPNQPLVNENYGLLNLTDIDSFNEKGFFLRYFTTGHLHYGVNNHSVINNKSRLVSVDIFNDNFENFEIKDLKQNISVFIPIEPGYKKEIVSMLDQENPENSKKFLSCFSSEEIAENWVSDCRSSWFNSTSSVNSLDVQNSLICSCSHLSFFSFGIEEKNFIPKIETQNNKFYLRPYFMSIVILLVFWILATSRSIKNERNLKILDVSYLNSLTCLNLKLFYPALLRINRVKNNEIKIYSRKLVLLLGYWNKIAKTAEKFNVDPMFLSANDRKLIDHSLGIKKKSKNDKEKNSPFFDIEETFLGDHSEENLKEGYIVDRFKKWRKLTEKDIEKEKKIDMLKIAEETGEDIEKKLLEAKEKNSSLVKRRIDFAHEFSKNISRKFGINLMDNVKFDNKLDHEEKREEMNKEKILAINKFFQLYKQKDKKNELKDLQKAIFLKMTEKEMVEKDRDILTGKYNEAQLKNQLAEKNEFEKWKSRPVERKLGADKLYNQEFNPYNIVESDQEEEEKKEFKKIFKNDEDDSESENDSTSLNGSFVGADFVNIGRERKKVNYLKKKKEEFLTKKERKVKEKLAKKKRKRAALFNISLGELYFSASDLFFKNHEILSLFFYKDPFNPTYLRITFSFAKIFGFYFYQIFLYKMNLNLLFNNGDYVRATVINPILTVIMNHIVLFIFKPFLFNDVHFIYYHTTAYLIRCRKIDDEFVKEMLKKFKSRSLMQGGLCFAIGFTYASYSIYTAVVDYKFFPVSSSFLFLVNFSFNIFSKGFCVCLGFEYFLLEFLRVMFDLDVIFKTMFSYINKEEFRSSSLNHRMLSLFPLKLKL